MVKRWYPFIAKEVLLPAEIILTARNLGKSYRIAGEMVSVLEGITLDVCRGDFVAVTGSSGSGKSTLLGVLSAIDLPSTGTIFLGDVELTALSEEKLAPLRNRQIGFVFQSFHLIPSLTALENVMFPAELAGDKDAREKACELLSMVGLAHRRDNFPQQLSGGEQQRAAICRALINGPDLLFADEPTGNLDSQNSKAIIDILVDLHRRHHTTLIIATHSASLASQADRIIRLHDGKIL